MTEVMNTEFDDILKTQDTDAVRDNWEDYNLEQRNYLLRNSLYNNRIKLIKLLLELGADTTCISSIDIAWMEDLQLYESLSLLKVFDRQRKLGEL